MQPCQHVGLSLVRSMWDFDLFKIYSCIVLVSGCVTFCVVWEIFVVLSLSLQSFVMAAIGLHRLKALFVLIKVFGSIFKEWVCEHMRSCVYPPLAPAFNLMAKVSQKIGPVHLGKSTSGSLC